MKLKINLIVFFSLTFFAVINASAQLEFIPDMTGKPMTDAKYVNLTGSPFLYEEWIKGEVKLADGKLVKPTELKYDQVEDKLLFRAENKVFEFAPKPISFVLLAPAKKNFFVLKDGKPNEGYFEVLNTGKVKLLKKVRKSILEVKGYNSANVNKTVDENKKFYVTHNGKETEVKLTKKSFLEALPEFKTQIDSADLKSNKQNIEDVFSRLVDSF